MLTWAKLGSVCLVSGLLLAAAAALAPASSTFLMIDASACIALAIGVTCPLSVPKDNACKGEECTGGHRAK